MAPLIERRLREPGRDRSERVIEQLSPLARPLASDRDLDPLLERIGAARYVLLGEASHGTSEYYTWRMRLSQRLIREKGFRFIAVEGDWPDCVRINRYVKHELGERGGVRAILEAFDRWPTWMWANREVETLAEWMREHNASLPAARRTGFYGLDVYSLWDSMRALIDYLDYVDPEAGRRARDAYECFAPFGEDEQAYARATAVVPMSCEEPAVRVLSELRRSTAARREAGREEHLDAEQNALIVKNAELYYRTMVRGGAASWNVRDSHMYETLERLMAFHGPDAKCIVWAHNTHVGDARYTDMIDQGELNIGQLVREQHGDAAVLVGFSCHRGSVIAGKGWGQRMQRMTVPPGRLDSYEALLHQTRPGGLTDKLIALWQAPSTPELLEPRGHRAIGVVYRPEYEAFGNYVPSVLPRRYDALLFIDETHALAPLHAKPEPTPGHDVPETYPFGV
jgi:erythromycin esterase-like protein